LTERRGQPIKVCKQNYLRQRRRTGGRKKNMQQRVEEPDKKMKTRLWLSRPGEGEESLNLFKIERL
jgi:hypothetical protein